MTSRHFSLSPDGYCHSISSCTLLTWHHVYRTVFPLITTSYIILFRILFLWMMKRLNLFLFIKLWKIKIHQRIVMHSIYWKTASILLLENSVGYLWGGWGNLVIGQFLCQLFSPNLLFVFHRVHITLVQHIVFENRGMYFKDRLPPQPKFDRLKLLSKLQKHRRTKILTTKLKSSLNVHRDILPPDLQQRNVC